MSMMIRFPLQKGSRPMLSDTDDKEEEDVEDTEPTVKV